LLRLIAGEAEPATDAVHRLSSIRMLAQLADDRLTVAQALGVADDLARCAASNAAKARLTMPLKPTGRWRRDCTPRWSKPACPPWRSIARSRR
jgi:hypothetical protein